MCENIYICHTQTQRDMKTQEQIFKADKKINNTPILFKQNGELKKIVKNALNRATYTSTTIHHTRTVGSGRFITIQSDFYYFKNLLEYAGCKYSTGNDAPRGGQNGNYIKCSKKAIELLKSLS